MSTAKVLYLKKGTEHTIHKYEDLKKLGTIAMKRGAKYFTQFDNDTMLNKHPVTYNKQSFFMLLSDRVDAVIIPEDQGEYLISTLSIRDKVEKATYFHKDYSARYIGVSKKSNHIEKLDQFEFAMSQISTNGKLDEIMKEYFYKKYDVPVNSLR